MKLSNTNPFSAESRLFNLYEIRQAAKLVHRTLPPTPQICWPLLERETGAEVWVKHENHTPIGAFKIRGGITFVDWLRKAHPNIEGLVTATRGNHGQSIALAARKIGLRARIYVPHGNSTEKNAAMQSLGAELIEIGSDFDEARLEAEQAAQCDGWFMVPSFHRELVRGVSSWAYEFFSEIPDLDRLYVPVGCGSSICGAIAVRDALGLKTQIVGVVAQGAPAAKNSFDSGHLVESDFARSFADGIAVRVPVQEALDIYAHGAERIVAVSEHQLADAVILYHRATHNLAEGAGAAGLAALMGEIEGCSGEKIGLALTGGNIDLDLFRRITADHSPLNVQTTQARTSAS